MNAYLTYFKYHHISINCDFLFLPQKKNVALSHEQQFFMACPRFRLQRQPRLLWVCIWHDFIFHCHSQCFIVKIYARNLCKKQWKPATNIILDRKFSVKVVKPLMALNFASWRPFTFILFSCSRHVIWIWNFLWSCSPYHGL